MMYVVLMESSLSLNFPDSGAEALSGMGARSKIA